jgi:hypothetical protein
LLLTAGCRTRIYHPAVPIAYDQQQLVDVWIGFNDRDATCYNLILQSGGDGLLYSAYQEGMSATNKISRWSTQGNLLHCEFQPDDSPTSPALLTCEIKKALLVATLNGVGGWKENILFRRIQFVEQSLWKAKTLEPSEGVSAVPQKR